MGLQQGASLLNFRIEPGNEVIRLILVHVVHLFLELPKVLLVDYLVHDSALQLDQGISDVLHDQNLVAFHA